MGESLILLIILFFIFIDDMTVEAERCVKNDNYCDCGDDEQQSNACSLYRGGRLFQCANLSFSQSIFLSKVGDGVCDCCDGSDELHNAMHISCPNVCSEIGLEIALESQAFTQRRSAGVAQRALLIQSSNDKLKHTRARIRRAQKLILEETNLLAVHRSNLVEEERIEKAEFEKILGESRVLFSNFFGAMKIEILQRILAVITLLTLEDGVEAILVECDDKHQLEGQDPDESLAFSLVSSSADIDGLMKDANAEHLSTVEVGVDGAASVQSPLKCDLTNGDGGSMQDITMERVTAMIQALSLIRLTMESTLEVLGHAISRLVESKSVEIDRFLELASIFPPGTFRGTIPSSPISIQKIGYKREGAELLRNKISAANSYISDLRKNATEVSTTGNLDYGPDNFLISFVDKCFSYRQKEYNYDICMFKEAKQESTSIGKYQKFEILPTPQLDIDRPDGINIDYGNSKESVYLIYDDGEICYGTQRPRSIKIKLECSGEEEKISEISEPEICTYTATLLTPLGCI